MNDELRDLFARRKEVDQTIASLKRDRSDLSVKITQAWQKEQLEIPGLTEYQPEEVSSGGSEPPD